MRRLLTVSGLLMGLALLGGCATEEAYMESEAGDEGVRYTAPEHREKPDLEDRGAEGAERPYVAPETRLGD